MYFTRCNNGRKTGRRFFHVYFWTTSPFSLSISRSFLKIGMGCWQRKTPLNPLTETSYTRLQVSWRKRRPEHVFGTRQDCCHISTSSDLFEWLNYYQSINHHFIHHHSIKLNLSTRSVVLSWSNKRETYHSNGVVWQQKERRRGG